MRRRDLVIVGGGTAGLVAAFGAALAGGRVALVERARTGGDCLWTGCVPSKSLLAAGELAHRMRTAGRVGLPPHEPEIDFGAVMGHVRAAQAAIAPHDSPERLRAAGVAVVEAEGRFEGPGRLAAGGRTLAFRTALVATGSEPVLPPVDGLAEVDALTSDTVWELDELPARLVVLGGGPVGCELAQAFARLGSRVTLVETGPALLPKDEPEAGALIAERLAGEGVDVRTGVTANRVEPADAGVAAAGRSAAGTLHAAGERIAFDRLLAATGRRPVTAGLGLDALGVRLRDDGAVVVDRTLRTTARGVFAAGDVTGDLPFTHVAGQHGRLVVANALFHTRRRFNPDAVPWITFTDPEVARTGLSEAQARERLGGGVTVERYDHRALDRAITAGSPYGFAKLVADRRGQLVGATVAGPAAGETIAGLTARLGAKIGTLSSAIRAYPTFAEAPARAADDHLRQRFAGSGAHRVTRPALAALRAIER